MSSAPASRPRAPSPRRATAGDYGSLVQLEVLAATEIIKLITRVLGSGDFIVTPVSTGAGDDPYQSFGAHSQRISTDAPAGGEHHGGTGDLIAAASRHRFKGQHDVSTPIDLDVHR